MPSVKKGIPERWEVYSNMGRQIPGTRFIAFKVPLKEGILALQTRDLVFSPRTVMDHCSDLGMVIDLTNTSRYYNPEEFTQNNVKHAKIFTEGHVVPSNNVVHRFFRVVEEFLEENKENEKLIGVHCTHGINRTGYLVCRYMIQRLGLPPDQAIIDFNSARGHALERHNYLSDLREAKWLHEPILLSSPSPQSRTPSGSWRGRTPSSGYATNRGPSNETPSRDRFFWRSPPESNGRDGSWRTRGGHAPPSGRFHHRRESGNWVRGNESPSLGTPSHPGQRNGYFRDHTPYSRPDSNGAYHNFKRRSGDFYSPNANSYDSSESSFDSRESKPRYLGSPRVARSYYENYYRGEVAQQYDRNFYRGAAGGGLGPHRPPPRNIPSDPNRPRQYRGPRVYRSPKVQEEPPPYHSNLEDPSYGAEPSESGLLPVPGPPRNPLSPGVVPNVFSPENGGARRRSYRFQPY